ncbi:MAG: CDP-alcohol phosphatidyltransferase family protein [Candidatus Hydrothermia bacterium]
MQKILDRGAQIADLLTALRFILVLILIALIPGGTGNLNIFLIVLYAAWSTDVLDGYFARLSGKEGKLGKYDGYVDSLMYVTTFLYSTSMDIYSFKFFFLIILTNIITVTVTRNLEVNQAFHFLYILLGFNALSKLSIRWFYTTIIWTIIVIFLKRNRLKVQIITFINSWKRLFTGK